MQRQLFSMMLGLSLIGGGLSVCPTPLMAAVAQALFSVSILRGRYILCLPRHIIYK